ncbi:hypothetical protein [Pseudoalteromonas rubra]|uniref:hypothetical protein n=1 Tax=Pseudoalteromonas rubra TaxID=43658 RepID=UPI000F7A5DA5|nr:hypothetical protein [Pseudoalteromonas rubra]
MINKDYDVDLIISVDENSEGRSVLDLNVLSLEGFFGSSPKLNRSARGVAKEFFLKNYSNYSGELHEIACLLGEFLCEYKQGSRLSVYSNIKTFLDFQFDEGRDLLEPKGVEPFCRHLQSKIYDRSIGLSHARSLYSSMNKFLLNVGVIRSDFVFLFKGCTLPKKADVYSESDFKLIISVVSNIYFGCSGILKEHVERSNDKKRSFSLSSCCETLEADIKHLCISFDYVQKHPLYWFMHSAFILFVIYTWSNEKQLLDLQADNLGVSDDGVESCFLYKGRANKFIRLNIGVSGLEADKKGIDFFKDFFEVRKCILEYLKERGSVIGHDGLFFVQNRLDEELRKFKLCSAIFLDHPISKELKSRSIYLQSVSCRALRKSIEQYVDYKLQDPFLTTSKAQHTWQTYLKNYSSGNVKDSRSNITDALRELTEKANSMESRNDRKALAEYLDICLVQGGSMQHQLNGLGCADKEGHSNSSKSFEKKQKKMNRTPKLCADLSNCVNCSHCVVVENVDAIYNLLSFKELIEFNKPVFIGSSKAVENYELKLRKIDLFLSLVDPVVLAKAKKKLAHEGVYEVWRIQ